MRNVVGVVSLAIFGIILSACSSSVRRVGDHECSNYLNDDFFELPLSEMNQEFEKFDLSRQYEFYICGVSFGEPPPIQLADIIGKRGVDAAVFLTGKLKTEKYDGIVLAILYVFDRMDASGVYDLNGDKALVSLISGRIDGFSDSDLKTQAKIIMVEVGMRK